MKKLPILALALGLFCVSALPLQAQDQPAQPPSAEELEKEKAEREAKAYRLLDQVIDEAQSLRLAENRIRVQINAADMLWDQNQGRARSLFSTAAESVAELGRTQMAAFNRRFAGDSGSNPSPAQGGGPPNLRAFQMRQELVMAAARHDAALAYQLLASTKPPAPVQTTADQRGPRVNFASEENLEQILLGRIASLDPKLAAQNAEQMIEKGQFPTSLPEVISQLQRQDAEAAAKLADKTVKRLQSANLLTSTEAAPLAQILLRAGPRPAVDASDSAQKTQPRGWPAVLEQSAYVDLLSTVVDAALKATPATQNTPRAQVPGRGRAGIASGPGRAPGQQPLTDAQIEQTNARRLLGGLTSMLPMVDQYLPAKASQLRQKMSDMGMTMNAASPGQAFTPFQGEPTADALIQAAANAPQQMQTRLYQQAAYKALEEGDADRARQIATEHLQSNARDAVMKRIDFREMTKKAEGARFDEVRQALARLQSDNEKIDLLLQVASDAQKSNPKLALQLLDEAKQITNHRATGYDHFEQQLKVAHALATVDPARSFEVLDPGISQLNELLAAAAVLSGFEISMFRDGEMAIIGGSSGLINYVNRYGDELALLARSDFERAETLAGRFQFAEARIMTRLVIVQGLLGVRGTNPRRSGVGNPPVSIRPN